MQAGIEIAHVGKTYGAVRALVGVTCTLAEGRVTALRGANGSGKSTLLSLIGTLARPSSGRIDHGPFGRTRAEVRGTLGWVGHDSLCYPDLTGRENIELAARLHGSEPSAAFERAAARFDLGAFAARPVRSYSRGQRQRVALARALVHRPRLVLLDEPTTGLDLATTAKLREVLWEELRDGVTIVMVTHDAAFVAGLPSDEIFLERGRCQPASRSPGRDAHALEQSVQEGCEVRTSAERV